MTTAAPHEWQESGHPAEVAVPREARAYQGMRAGIVTRVIAGGVDYAVIAFVIAAMYVGWSALFFFLDPVAFTWPSPPLALLVLLDGAAMILYWTISWTTTGRSYGNHLMGLRVVNFRGDHMSLVGAFLRAVFCVLVPVAIFWVVVSGANRAAWDVVLRTSVIYDWRARTREVTPTTSH